MMIEDLGGSLLNKSHNWEIARAAVNDRPNQSLGVSL